jgi:hypothetical protein
MFFEAAISSMSASVRAVVPRAFFLSHLCLRRVGPGSCLSHCIAKTMSKSNRISRLDRIGSYADFPK